MMTWIDALTLTGLIILIIILCIVFYLFVLVKIIRKIYPFPIPSFLTSVIDNPIRRRYFQKPYLIAERMHLEPGMTVLEIGPGKGSYTKAVASKVTPNGKVYAIDIQVSIIEKLCSRLDKEDITNIIPTVDDAYDLSFEDNSIDCIFAVTCIPEIPEPVKALQEFKRVLKPGGIVSLCEFFIDPDYPLRKTEKKWAETAGFKLQEEFGNWFVYQLNFSY